MPNSAELFALAARCEAATGPDRELDCLIENTLSLARVERDPRVSYGDADYTRVPPKPYTGSLDAAMMLVPEGWDYLFMNGNGYDEVSLTNDAICRIAWAASDSLPLAICAAALRALAFREESND